MSDKVENKASKVVPVGNHKLNEKVTFIVEYGKDFKGNKHLIQGSKHVLHKLHAQRLEAKGIGKIV